MQLLLAAVQASTLAADVQASGDAVACTLPFSELTATVHAQGIDEVVRGLTVEARVPAGEGRLELTPERGLGAAVAALREIEVDDATVDNAWVIRGDGPALLLALLPALRALALAAPVIHVEGEQLKVAFDRPVALIELGGRVHDALALWERAASFRLGAA